jgi:hypothetical protein
LGVGDVVGAQQNREGERRSRREPVVINFHLFTPSDVATYGRRPFTWQILFQRTEVKTGVTLNQTEPPYEFMCKPYGVFKS